MAQHGHLPTDNLRHRRSGSHSLQRLALLALLSAQPVAQAQDAPISACTECHNSDGNSTNPKYPKIAGQDPVYFIKQIKDFKSYKRINEIMGPIAWKIPEADIDALATYFSEQKQTHGTVTDQRLAARGQLIYDKGIDGSGVPACAECHERDGSGWRKNPRLAGQHKAYLIKQLESFRSGVRNNDSRMRAVARRLAKQEMAAVIEYIAGLKGGDE